MGKSTDAVFCSQVLAQVTGTKRMLLYPPSALSRAHLYPDWHPLRRRSKVRLDADVDVDDARRAFPRWTGSRFSRDEDEPSNDSSNDSEPFEETAGSSHASPPGAWEAVLGPGDVLVFPRGGRTTPSRSVPTCAPASRGDSKRRGESRRHTKPPPKYPITTHK